MMDDERTHRSREVAAGAHHSGKRGRVGCQPIRFKPPDKNVMNSPVSEPATAT